MHQKDRILNKVMFASAVSFFLSQNISIIADDEENQDDDDDDDEFGNLSLAEKHSLLENDDDTDSPIRVCNQLLFRRFNIQYKKNELK